VSPGYVAPTRTSARTPSPSSSVPAVLAYQAPASGQGCIQQYEPQVRGLLQYPYEFMSSTCTVPTPPFRLTPGLIAAMAFAGVGILTVVAIIVICYLQARRAMALRQARANSVRTLMHAASGAKQPVVIDAMSVVAAPEANVLAAAILAKRAKGAGSASRIPLMAPVQTRGLAAGAAAAAPPPPPAASLPPPPPPDL